MDAYPHPVLLCLPKCDGAVYAVDQSCCGDLHGSLLVFFFRAIFSAIVFPLLSLCENVPDGFNLLFVGSALMAVAVAIGIIESLWMTPSFQQVVLLHFSSSPSLVFSADNVGHSTSLAAE